MREQIAIYSEVRAPRWGREEREVVYAKRSPKYVHGRIGQSALLHRVLRVQLRWWTCGPSGEYLVRRQSPRLIAETNCSKWFRIDGVAAKTCEMPNPETVLCGMCHGTGPNFPHGKAHKIPQSIARVKLGCVARGVAV